MRPEVHAKLLDINRELVVESALLVARNHALTREIQEQIARSRREIEGAMKWLRVHRSAADGAA